LWGSRGRQIGKLWLSGQAALSPPDRSKPMDGVQSNEPGSSLVSITVLSVSPMRAGRLFALASVEIDIDGVRIEGQCAPPLGRPGWNSRRSATPQANRVRRLSCPTKSMARSATP
jgi:hypothetical protein